MNIGYMVPEFPTQTHVFFWREVQALREIGATVSLLSTRRPAPGTCRHAFAEQAAQQTHYVFPPQVAAVAARLFRPARLLAALRYITALRETSWKRRARLALMLLPAADLAAHAQSHRIDHIHVHSCADAAHLAALCKLLGGPSFSLTLHGDLPVYGVDHRRKAEHAAFVSCVTRPLQKQLMEATGLPAERLPIIWMGVDTARFHDIGARRPQAGRLHLLTVARLHPTKGHRYTLEAMRSALDQGLDLRFTIVGDGPARMHIEAEIERLCLSDRVEMLGTRSESEVLEQLQHCDALALSSCGPGEAAPVSVMEAMACGMPVVASVIGGTPDMIADGIDGFLVPQKDAASIAARLVVLANDLVLRQRIGHAARARALGMFDAKHLAGRLHAAIDRA